MVRFRCICRGSQVRFHDPTSRFPPLAPAGHCSPASAVLSRRYEFLTPIPPRFVSFAWWYLDVHSLSSLPGGRVRRQSLELVTTYDARLASGRWSSSTGRAFHPQDSYERFQICILHFIRLSHACLAQSDTPKRHRFDSPCWQFLIQWRSQSEYRWTSVERECDCDVDVAYRFVHGKVTGVCPTHSISFKTNIDRPVW